MSQSAELLPHPSHATAGSGGGRPLQLQSGGQTGEVGCNEGCDGLLASLGSEVLAFRDESWDEGRDEQENSVSRNVREGGGGCQGDQHLRHLRKRSRDTLGTRYQ